MICLVKGWLPMRIQPPPQCPHYWIVVCIYSNTWLGNKPTIIRPKATHRCCIGQHATTECATLPRNPRVPNRLPIARFVHQTAFRARMIILKSGFRGLPATRVASAVTSHRIIHVVKFIHPKRRFWKAEQAFGSDNFRIVAQSTSKRTPPNACSAFQNLRLRWIKLLQKIIASQKNQHVASHLLFLNPSLQVCCL